MTIREMVLDVGQVAAARVHREDEPLPHTGGPAGNARLTAWTGMVLLALLLVEVVTALDVEGMLGWHVVVGTILVPVALVKTGSTMWRIARYYTRNGSYRRAGPPPTLLRLLGPLLVVSTLGLLGTGLALMALGPQTGQQPLVTVLGQGLDVLTLHQGFFVVFAITASLHVLARVVPALAVIGRRAERRAAVSGRSARTAVVALAIAAGVLGSVLIWPTVAAWSHARHDGFHDGRHRDDGISQVVSLTSPPLGGRQ